MNFVLKIILLIVFLILFIVIMKYLFKDASKLTNNIQDGKIQSTISSSSLTTDGISSSSNNFTYSVWFYVSDWNYRYGEPKVIFGRMGAKSQSDNGSIRGLSGVDPCPVVFLGGLENNVTIGMACYPGVDAIIEKPENKKSIIHKCTVNNVPIQKWVNLLISVYGRTLDVYIDGKLVKTCLLPGIARINQNADIQLTPRGGFDGWTSKLQYWANSLNPQEAWNVYVKGFNDKGVLGSYVSPDYSMKVSVTNNSDNSTNEYTLL
jgi:hypothetical protein